MTQCLSIISNKMHWTDFYAIETNYWKACQIPEKKGISPEIRVSETEFEVKLKIKLINFKNMKIKKKFFSSRLKYLTSFDKIDQIKCGIS